ncbi:MAG: type II toxin-antitoxin system VapB family antitoxin [Aestuariivirga sp.]
MTFYVKDPATDKAVRRLAKLKGKTLTETIREAVEKEYRDSKKKRPLRERLDELTARFNKLPKSGLKADKAFFDELSGDI